MYWGVGQKIKKGDTFRTKQEVIIGDYKLLKGKYIEIENVDNPEMVSISFFLGNKVYRIDSISWNYLKTFFEIV